MPDIYVAPSADEPKRLETVAQARESHAAVLGQKADNNPLASYRILPPDIRVEIQDRNEKILLLLRRHPVTNLPWILGTIVMILAPLLFAFFPPFQALPGRFQFMTTLLWYMLTTGMMLEGFLSWYFNVYIVTDERVIDVDFLSLIYKNISAAKIEQIEDITFQMGGALPSMLDYGNVFIQTAAEKTEFEFEKVPHPQKVAKFLNEMMLEEEQEKLEGRIR